MLALRAAVLSSLAVSPALAQDRAVEVDPPSPDLVERLVRQVEQGVLLPARELVPSRRMLEAFFRGVWVEVRTERLDERRFDFDFELPPFNLPGNLYIAGGNDLVRIRLTDDQRSNITVPGPGTTAFLAVGDTHERLFVSTNGQQYLIAAVDLFSHQVVEQEVQPADSTWKSGALAVAPGSQLLHAVHTNSGVMATFDANDLSAGGSVEYLPGVGMPMLIDYRPGMLDLYVSDFWDDSTHIAIRRPFIDWQKGTLTFGWAGIELPASKANDDGNTAAGMAFLTEQGLVVTVNSRGDEVVVVDEVSRTPLARKTTSAMPFYVTADPHSDADEGRVFVTALQGSALSVYTIQRTADAANITLEDVSNPCDGSYPVKVVFAGSDPDTAYLLCTEEVVALDAKTLEVKRRIPVGGDDMVWSSR